MPATSLVRYTVFPIFAILYLLLNISGVYAMTGGGDGGTIPVPSKDFKAEFVDSKGVKTLAGRVTREGKIFLEGKRGSSVVTIPFEKVDEITFEPNSITADNYIKTTVKLEGTEIMIEMDARKKFYGETEFGTFQIYTKDTLKIRFIREK